MLQEVDTNGTATPQTARTNVYALIIGAGPAGASLACFLASHGITGLMVSRAHSTADTPRAHITNMAALECLRDIGLEDDLIKVSSEGHCMQHTRWCHSMAGEEYARIHSWGNDPARIGDYRAASPCKPVDLPQTLLEPSLVRYATTHGFQCRFDTGFVRSVDLGPDGVLTTLKDEISKAEYQVHSRYVFGADGARSRVVEQLGLPLCQKPGGGVAINILVEADLTHLIRYRQGNLHWVMQPDQELCDFGQMAIVRMVKPWHEWMFIFLPKPGFEGPEPSEQDYLRQVKVFIGDDSVSAQILGVSKWTINETFAEKYSQGNIFCLGDAVHRHPPFNGLGSNTCIQDAFNLAWKVAYVKSGLASPRLLSSYSDERQPVGQTVVSRANDGFREHAHVWDVLGMLENDITTRRAILKELNSSSDEGEQRRARFRAAIRNTCHEFHGLGIEMNQHYQSGAIVSEDETEPFRYSEPALNDPILYYERSTYPGRRVPHAWLNKKIPGPLVSTIDLTGKGTFTLFAGTRNDAWRRVIDDVRSKLGIAIAFHTIGLGQEWIDPYGTWQETRGVGESGAVLVRPDRFVAWRSQDENGADRLLPVLQHLLGLS